MIDNNTGQEKSPLIKILFVARTYPPLVGGMERFASDFYHHMQELSQVRLIANPIGKKNIIPFFFKVMVYLIIHSRDYDIIHFNDAILAPLLLIIRIFSNTKVTFTVHGLDVVYQKYGYQRLVIPFLRRADKIFPVSQYTKNQCLQRHVPEKNLQIIPNGLDFAQDTHCTEENKASVLSKIPQDLTDKTILFTIGRLIARKGHVWFIENVFPLLPSHYVYLIAGNGPEYSIINQVIRKSGLENRIILMGYVPEGEKRCLFQLADVFIMPNISDQHDQEGFGIVLLEAGKNALPVVASDIEGIKDAVIDNVSGLLVREKDARAFYNAILHIDIDRNQIFDQLRQKYDWQVTRQMYLDEFRELLPNI